MKADVRGVVSNLSVERRFSGRIFRTSRRTVTVTRALCIRRSCFTGPATSSEEARHHSPLYLDIVEDGILCVDRDGFFRSILEAMRARMRLLGSRRVSLPAGSWYWDLKPEFTFGEIVEL